MTRSHLLDAEGQVVLDRAARGGFFVYPLPQLVADMGRAKLLKVEQIFSHPDWFVWIPDDYASWSEVQDEVAKTAYARRRTARLLGMPLKESCPSPHCDLSIGHAGSCVEDD